MEVVVRLILSKGDGCRLCIAWLRFLRERGAGFGRADLKEWIRNWNGLRHEPFLLYVDSLYYPRATHRQSHVLSTMTAEAYQAVSPSSILFRLILSAIWLLGSSPGPPSAPPGAPVLTPLSRDHSTCQPSSIAAASGLS